MENKEPKNKHIGVRVTNETKKDMDIIINILNEIREPNDPKYNYSYAYDFLIDFYKSNPNFELKIKEHKLINNIEKLEDDINLLNIQLTKLKNELKEVRSQLKNKSLDNFNNINNNESILLTPKLKKARDLILSNCKQRNINKFENIKEEMFFSVATSLSVDKHKLKEAVKIEFNK